MQAHASFMPVYDDGEPESNETEFGELLCFFRPGDKHAFVFVSEVRGREAIHNGDSECGWDNERREGHSSL